MNNIFLKQFLLVCAYIFLYANTNAQQFPVEIIRYNGPPNEYLNIVIMGDGYTATQQDKFIHDANKAFDGFFAQEPFSAYKDSINVFAIKVVSNAEGASMDPENLIDNYFGSSYWSYGLERLLVSWNYYEILNVLNTNTPFYDEAAIIVNHQKYGGSGGEFAVFSTNTEAIELLLHEFGHSFADLADEYWAGSNYAAEKTNMTQDNNPETIRWKEFLYKNDVGIYPHEESPKWYRPHQNCKMRYLGADFCDVCHNKISEDIAYIANTDTLGTPVGYFIANTLEVEQESSIQFLDLSTNRPGTWEWRFEGGIPEVSTEQNPLIEYKTQGQYSVELTVTNTKGSNTIRKTEYIIVNAPVNINHPDYTHKVSIYPNPVKDILHISQEGNQIPESYQVLNSLGILVQHGSYVKQINTSALSSGMYILQIKYKNSLVSKRFVKK